MVPPTPTIPRALTLSFPCSPTSSELPFLTQGHLPAWIPGVCCVGPRGSRNTQARKAELEIMGEGRGERWRKPVETTTRTGDQEGGSGFNSYVPSLGEPVPPLPPYIWAQPIRRDGF